MSKKVMDILLEAREAASTLPAQAQTHGIDERDHALLQITVLQADVDTSGALRTVAMIRNNAFRAAATSSAAASLARQGDFDGALGLMESIPKDQIGDPSYVRPIAREQLKAGDHEGALETVLRMQPSRARALSDLAEEYVDLGDLQGAMDAVALVEGEAERDRALAEVVRAQAKNDLKGALLTAGRIQDHAAKAHAMWGIVEAQARAGKPAEALRTATDILFTREGQSDAFVAIASAQANAGDSEAALKTAGRIVDPHGKDLAFQEIATAQAKRGDVKGALGTAERIGEPRFRRLVLAMMPSLQAEAGDVEGALAKASQIPDDAMRSEALAGIARAQAQLGDVMSALQTMNRVEPLEDGSKAGVYLLIARDQTQAGDSEGALSWARELVKPYEKSLALCGVAIGLLRQELKSGDS